MMDRSDSHNAIIFIPAVVCGPTRMNPVPFDYHHPSINPASPQCIGNSTIGYTLQTHPHTYILVYLMTRTNKGIHVMCILLLLLQLSYYGCSIVNSGAETALDNTVRDESIAPQINIHIPFEFAANQSDC